MVPCRRRECSARRLPRTELQRNTTYSGTPVQQQSVEVGTASCSSSSLPPLPQQPPALQLHILSFLPPNDRVLSGRLVSPDAASAFSEPQHRTASLSQPLPPHAVPWAQAGWQPHVRQLALAHKMHLLCTAAASGSEANLEVAWALMQPSVFPELLQGRYPVPQQYRGGLVTRDPGAAAARAGHPQLLSWLLRHCRGMLCPDLILESAAQHCDLAGLQLTWRLLQDGCGSRCPVLDQRVLEAAAESVTPDAVAKMEWVLYTAGEGTCSLQDSTAAAAARSGDLGRLRWLRDRGCPVRSLHVLLSALGQADLAVAQWLVDEVGCRLPQSGRAGSAWATLFHASTGSPDCVRKWRWLLERGALLLRPSLQHLRSLACAVIQRGQAEELRGLLLLPQMATAEGREALQQALDQAEGPGCIEVAMHLQQAGCLFTRKAYITAAGAGDLDMVRWLALEARVPTAGMSLCDLVECWPNDRVARSRDLLQALQLLVGEAGHQDEDIVPAACRAASRGHVPVVQYLLQLLPGYAPGSLVVAAAVVGGCEALVEWLVERPGCRAALSGDPFQYYISALMCRDRGVLATLRRLGVPWGAEDVAVWAVETGCELPVLRWLLEQGAPVGSICSLARALATRVKCRGLKSADAKVVYRMAVRVAAGEPV